MLRFIVAAAAFCTTAAAAQDTITVTAPKIDPATVAPAARAFVQGALPTPVMGQYARWQAPVCLKIIGLDDAIAARVSRRITSIALASRVPVAGAGCAPNLIVWFSGDARRDVG
ncbi:MAG: hypothetical protein ACOYLS_03120, partial [Polymorphobacter sp.]